MEKGVDVKAWMNELDKKMKKVSKEYNALDREKKDILWKWRESPEKFRITRLTPLTRKIREKAMELPEIRQAIEKNRLRIQDVALVTVWNERVAGTDPGYEWPWPASYKNLTDPTSNMWTLSERFLYGGPGDKMRVFFDSPDDQRKQPYITGFMVQGGGE